MKPRWFIISALLLALMISTSYTSVLALPAGTWLTGIKIQNFGGSTAQLQVNFFSSTGAQSSFSISGSQAQVASGKAIEFYLPAAAYAGLGSGQFAAVVSSNQPIGAVVTNMNYDAGVGDNYTSQTPATQVSIPYVYHNHNSYSTEIVVQNTSSSQAATGSVTFTEPASAISIGDGAATKVVNFNIPANGTATFDTATSQYDDLNWFIGTAQISSSQPVTAVASQSRITGAGAAAGNLMIQGRGLTSADQGQTIYFPSLYNQFSSASGTWNSGVTIQNPNGASVNVTVTFTADPDSFSGPFTGSVNVTIPANQGREFYLPGTNTNNGAIPALFKGSAIATVTSGGDIVGSAQSINYPAAGGYGVGVGYTGFANGSSSAFLPTVYNWPSGDGTFITGIKIQNVGVNAVTVDVDYFGDSDSNPGYTAQSTRVIQPGKAIELYFGGAILDGGGSIPVPFKGSVRITATGSGTPEIVATTLHTNYGSTRKVAVQYPALQP